MDESEGARGEVWLRLSVRRSQKLASAGSISPPCVGRARGDGGKRRGLSLALRMAWSRMAMEPKGLGYLVGEGNGINNLEDGEPRGEGRDGMRGRWWIDRME